MSSILSMLSTIPTPDALMPARICWTKQACEYLESGGLLVAGKYELIQGEIIPKMPQKFLHMRVITRLFAYLIATFGEDKTFSQGSLSLSSTSSAEPDGFVTISAYNNNSSNNTLSVPVPSAADVALVVEVSDTTLRFDLTAKATLYASEKIAEYWVIDIENRVIHVHRDPQNDVYQSITKESETSTIAPLHAPQNPILIKSLLP
jgi:Uma2 family endonuclease